MHWRDVESLLNVGASLEPISGARVRVELNRMEDVLHRPHHSNVLDASALTHLHEFLARPGVTPSLYEAKARSKDEPARERLSRFRAAGPRPLVAQSL